MINHNNNFSGNNSGGRNFRRMQGNGLGQGLRRPVLNRTMHSNGSIQRARVQFTNGQTVNSLRLTLMQSEQYQFIDGSIINSIRLRQLTAVEYINRPTQYASAMPVAGNQIYYGQLPVAENQIYNGQLPGVNGQYVNISIPGVDQTHVAGAQSANVYIPYASAMPVAENQIYNGQLPVAGNQYVNMPIPGVDQIPVSGSQIANVYTPYDAAMPVAENQIYNGQLPGEEGQYVNIPIPGVGQIPVEGGQNVNMPIQGNVPVPDDAQMPLVENEDNSEPESDEEYDTDIEFENEDISEPESVEGYETDNEFEDEYSTDSDATLYEDLSGDELPPMPENLSDVTLDNGYAENTFPYYSGLINHNNNPDIYRNFLNWSLENARIRVHNEVQNMTPEELEEEANRANMEIINNFARMITYRPRPRNFRPINNARRGAGNNRSRRRPVGSRRNNRR